MTNRNAPGSTTGYSIPVVVWVIAALAVGLIAISNESLWIDEGFMAAKATQPGLHSWWQTLLAEKGSDLQMPFYMFYTWACAKVLGSSEWMLRVTNLPWFLVGVAAFTSVFKGRQRTCMALAALLCPFAWVYLNEARPYCMQLGLSLVIFSALLRLKDGTLLSPKTERRWLLVLFAGIIFLCGSSLLGVIWAGAAFLAIVATYSWKRIGGLARRNWPSALLSFAVLAALGAYYLWTLKLGNRDGSGAENPASGSVMKSAAHFRTGLAGGTDFKNLAFLAYEMLGLGGLGPGRFDIRQGGPQVFKAFFPPLIVFAAVMAFVLVRACLAACRSPNRKAWMLGTLCALLPVAALLAAGYVFQFRILGRHITPLMAPLLFLLGTGLCALWEGEKRWTSFSVAFIALCLASCLSFRFAARHRKDDYREAATLAMNDLAHGRCVWWVADKYAAAYYHLPLTSETGATNAAHLVQNSSADSIKWQPTPDVIFTSKPDLYDSAGVVMNFIEAKKYLQADSPMAFTIWIRNAR